MKKLVYLLLVFFFTQTTNASASISSDTIPSLSKEDYLLKSKRQRTGAIVSLTGGILAGTVGVVMVIGGSALFFVEAIDFTNSSEQPDNRARNLTTAGVALLLVGTAAVVTSIVLFSHAAKNKKVAMSMTAQPVQQLQQHGVVRTFVPSVRFTIDL